MSSELHTLSCIDQSCIDLIMTVLAQNRQIKFVKKLYSELWRPEMWRDCFMTHLNMTVLAQNRQIKIVIKSGAKVFSNHCSTCRLVDIPLMSITHTGKAERNPRTKYKKSECKPFQLVHHILHDLFNISL